MKPSFIGLNFLYELWIINCSNAEKELIRQKNKKLLVLSSKALLVLFMISSKLRLSATFSQHYVW